ncbi:hypothetical protein [Mesobacillus selenatarsenatis]|uniref:hypothetical protein n=1 Tax=Mesobacillus selenatarsenatis TaxID=388741 RepID=UPI0005A60F85|nr:hypothetical protein [Mesobacillus selenatarsenatis]
MKSHFDFIGRTEIEKCSRLSRNAETGDSDKEALFASVGGVEVSEFLGGDTRQIRKAEATAQLLQALEGLTVKSIFDFIGRTKRLEELGAVARHATRGARRWS